MSTAYGARNGSFSEEDRIPLMNLSSDSDGPNAFRGNPEDSSTDTVEYGKSDRLKETSKKKRKSLASLTTWMAFSVSIISFLASATAFLRTVSPKILNSNIDHADATSLGLYLWPTFGYLNTSLLRRPSHYLGIERVPEIKLRLTVERILSSNNLSHAHEGEDINNNVNDHETIEDGIPDSHSMGKVDVPGELGSSSSLSSTETKSFLNPKKSYTLNSLYPDEYMHESDEEWVLISPWHSTLLQYDTSKVNWTALFSEKAEHVSIDEVKCTITASFPTLNNLIASGQLLTIEGPPNLDLSVKLFPIMDPQILSGLTWNKWSSWKGRPMVESTAGRMRVAYGLKTEMDIFTCGEMLESSQLLIAELCCPKADIKDPENVFNCRVEYPLPDVGPEFGKANLNFALVDYMTKCISH